MIHKFIPKVLKVPAPVVELVCKRGHYITSIKTPEPDPADRVTEEYDDTSTQIE